jgi:hypothetical protein
MNSPLSICFCWATLLAAIPAQAQGTFQNLNFESANLTPIPSGQDGGEVPISSALPGWSGDIGDTPVTQVLQNNYTLGQAGIDIFGPNWNSADPGIIDGNYTVFLQAGQAPGGIATDNASLWQDGTIPANTESLVLKAWSFRPNAPFSVSFNGNVLSPFALSTGQSASGQNYTLYGYNIAAYAGQTGQLELTAPFGTTPSWVEFDDISFSTQTVPEPSPLALTGVGALLFALCRRFAPKRP